MSIPVPCTFTAYGARMMTIQRRTPLYAYRGSQVFSVHMHEGITELKAGAERFSVITALCSEDPAC